jgi:hypothetical protein
MNGRQRIMSLLNGLPHQGLSWNALVDTNTLSAMPAEVQAETVVDFCRRLGCDVIQLGDFSMPEALWVGDPYQVITPEVLVTEHSETDGTLVRLTHTPWGELTATFRSGHPVKYPVTNLQEVHILKNIWQSTIYREADPGWQARYEKMNRHIGQDGIYTHFLWPSPVQRLIEYELGLENFYYLLHDQPVEMEELMEVMQARWIESVELHCQRSPAEVIISAENTSTTLISPAVYQQYSLPHLKEFVQTVHSHHKKAVLHMCGLINHLLPDIQQTDLDGIHALTPPTIGDTPFEQTMEFLGGKVTLMSILDGTVFHSERASAQDIWNLLDRVYTSRIREGNFILVVAADGLPTPLWKFEAVQKWMQKNGA